MRTQPRSRHHGQGVVRRLHEGTELTTMVQGLEMASLNQRTNVRRCISAITLDLLEGPGVRSGLDDWEREEDLALVEFDLNVASEDSRPWLVAW